MDFIVSKVAMCICALMVVSILGGMFDKDVVFKSGGDLGDIVKDFCSVVDAIGRSRSAARSAWDVPHSSSGETVFLSIEGTIVRMRAGSDHAIGQPVFRLRTWSDSSDVLNMTVVDSLDKNAPSLSAHSGQTIVVFSRIVTLDNQQTPLLFAALDI